MKNDVTTIRHTGQQLSEYGRLRDAACSQSTLSNLVIVTTIRQYILTAKLGGLVGAIAAVVVRVARPALRYALLTSARSTALPLTFIARAAASTHATLFNITI